jgi:signal peptidase II
LPPSPSPGGAGAFGNAADRLVRGYVIDFIEIHRWPIFNVADIAIVAGVALLALAQLRRRREPDATGGAVP